MKSLVATLAALIAIPLVAASVQTAAPPAPDSEQLVSSLTTALDAPGWGTDRWGVLVVSLDAGDTLFAHRADVPLAPASNMKLFTTAAALHYLGPDYRYTTFLTGMGPVRDSVLEGDLYLYGTGDPTLSARFFDSKTAVWEALADSLLALGVTRIAGDLVGDASYFEGPSVGEGWDTTYITHTYAAPSSALSYNDNVVTLRVTAGEVGGPPEVLLVPGGTVQLRNDARTVDSGRGQIRVERRSYDGPLVLTGTIRRGAGAQWRAVPVPDPAAFAISVFEEVLRDRGVTVEGGLRVVQGASASPVTGQQVFAPVSEEDTVIQVLAVHRSPPLLEILEVINQRSHNLYADAVLRTVGRVASGHGSMAAGEAAVLALIESSDGDSGTLRMDDGSGLSRLNRASARALVELLAFMAESPHDQTFRETLPEAATSRGLRRMQQTDAAGNLRAKTGTIERVSALSGYVRAKNGELIAFSILSNDVPSTYRAKRVEDRIGARLASFDRPIPTTRVLASTAAADTVGVRAGAGEATAYAARGTGSDAQGGVETTEAVSTAQQSYEIRAGDTLEAIAREHGTTVEALREANPGVNDRRLIPGRSLKLPAGAP